MANVFMIMLPLLILSFMFPPTTCFNNQTDLLSLLAFKSSIDLDPQGALNSWNQTLHLCSWNGIRCSQKHRDRVIGINLMSQGLVGSLSPHIGNLSFLRAIILQNNTFHSQIPTQIGLLRRLEVVELSNNSFVGPIPTNLSRCPNLVYLNLIDNHLTGTIPVELGSLSKLETLYLAKNNLLGPIPSFIGNISSLERLSFLSCGLAGEIPESLAQLQKLRFLKLSDNGLTGTIPSALFNMSAIQNFSVYSNQLHGVIPSNIGLTLPNLMAIHLWGNQFSGPIPASISNSNASLLEDIALAFNHFTGPVPRLATQTHLQRFLIQKNFIEDDISFISSLTNSTELTYLELGSNLFSGSLPHSIGNLSINLRSLYINTNNIHGKIPLGIGNLVSLTSLFLFKNHFEGPIPPDITKLSNLIDFVAGGNTFSDILPPSFGNFTLLSHLYLNYNFFSGNLPTTLGNCTNLIEFDLSHNNFNGLIPQEIMHISSISIIFYLSYNAFEGSIPNEVGSLTNLAALDLSNNRLSGIIPNSLSHCGSLQKLYLEGNLLEGEIPTGISALTGLQDLDLSRNNLSGQIPKFLGKMNIANLNLSFNRLNGEVPITGVFKNKTAVSLDGNQQLCGGISELKLPPCFPSKSHKKILPTLLKILVPILSVGGVCLAIFAIFTYKQRTSLKNATPASLFSGVQFMRLSYADLLKATGGFAENNLLGAGKFGSVYKGILDDHGRTQVAVKVLNLFVQGASKSFLAECNALREVRHRNLLNILTVCESIDFKGNDFKALVYEFKANGSLEKWLHHSKEQECEQHGEFISLTMIQRVNISIDIARAIEYLHLGTESTIIHGDLKPSNILLDQEMTACLGDFGLAKIMSDIVPSYESSTSTGIRGTIGYVPPEYGVTRSVSAQGDVYSYGIVLLEMFTNTRPTDDFLTDNVNLHNFVSSALPDRVMEIVDPQIQTGRDVYSHKIKDSMSSILSIGVSCSKEIARDRMSITDVVNELCKIQKLLCR